MPHVQPFDLAGHWYKGNLHTHTTQSDGNRSPEEAVAWYRSNGYDFLAISDHWVLTPGQAVDARFVTLSATELHGRGYHMLVLGLDQLPPRDLEDDPQAIIQFLTPQEALSYVAHPYWTGAPCALTTTLEGLDGIEVYNSVCELMDGLGHGRVHWDECLTAGRRLTGLAVDDVHWRHGAEGGGYIMVRAPELSEKAIISAIRNGQFYSSMGPVIHDLRTMPTVDGWELCIACSPCKSITFHTAGPHGLRHAADPDGVISSACLTLRPEQIYVRAECCDADGRIAWTNPVYLSDLLPGGTP